MDTVATRRISIFTACLALVMYKGLLKSSRPDQEALRYKKNDLIFLNLVTQ